MTTEDFITNLFYRVDETLRSRSKHAQAGLYPSEVVTLALLFALKGVGNRAFYRWVSRDYRAVPAAARAHPVVSVVQPAPRFDRPLHGRPDLAGGRG